MIQYFEHLFLYEFHIDFHYLIELNIFLIYSFDFRLATKNHLCNWLYIVVYLLLLMNYARWASHSVHQIVKVIHHFGPLLNRNRMKLHRFWFDMVWILIVGVRLDQMGVCRHCCIVLLMKIENWQLFF